ncbi:MAG: TAXI family TRAP transporter solute-binding subunit [Melioribacteraceae bacterium]|nr:TAXI family TRAP transporter solute-binding subunit [Melioribacteraceae bacterium]
MKKYLPQIAFIIFLFISFPGCKKNVEMYRFSGGPSGGTFQYYASAISKISKNNNIRVLASSSAGSIENIRTVNSGKSKFGVAYSGHVFAGREGRLPLDTAKYKNVMAVSFFYGAPAQLIVKRKSGITSPLQLEGKRVGVGNAGSGAAANAEIYFRQLGIWDKIEKEFLGYRGAADAFNNGQLDAFWVFAGFPNASVLEAALQSNVILLDTYLPGKAVNLFEDYPYFGDLKIPANTYSGQEQEIQTFQDAALWVCNKDVPADVVYRLLSIIYNEDGLNYMMEVHKSAKEMTIKNGTKGIVTPLHPGAERFWKEKGLLN